MENLENLAENMGIILDNRQTTLFGVYLSELIEWNKKTNLTAIRDKDEIVLKHFIDSLSVVTHIPENAQKILDIGAGAGFPGIPVKIAKPYIHLTLLDSVGKKTQFLEHVSKILNLENTKVITGRAEEYGHDELYRGKYDVVLARAVAPLSALAEYALPFLKVGGIFIAQKNFGAYMAELQEKTLKRLGGKLIKIVPVKIETLPDREIILIEKIIETPKEFPRAVGVPGRKPL